MAHKTEFLYLSEPDTIAAGVLDVPKCINNAEEVFTLLAKGDYLMGGNNHNNHGMYIVFPKESPFPNMPVAGPDRRFVAMPAYLGGRFDICGQKWYGSNAANKSKGLPRSVLMVTLNNKDTGEPLAYMSANLLSAARTGAGPACVAALGGILIPAMVRRGYSTEYAAATTASAGTIGPVIPPSIPMIVYAVSAGTSVTALFLGGVGPGVLMGLIMILYNFLISKKRGYKGTPRGGGFLWVLKQIWKGLPALLMPVIVLGGIYSGLATPTESAVLGVIYTLIVGFFVFRTLNFKLLKEALVEAAMMSAPVMFLLGGAAVFGRLLTLQRIPEMLATAMLGLSSSKYVVMLLIMAFLLVAGMFIDTTSNIVLFAPLFCPIAQKLGLDLVYFGILMVVNLCIGFLTPPLGVNLFVAKNISGAPLGGLVKELMPYIGILVLALVLMVFFPQIVMFLPNLVGG